MKPFTILFPRTSEGATSRAHYYSLLETFRVSITDFAVSKASDDWMVLILGAGTSPMEVQAIAKALKWGADVQPSWPWVASLPGLLALDAVPRLGQSALPGHSLQEVEVERLREMLSAAIEQPVAPMDWNNVSSLLSRNDLWRDTALRREIVRSLQLDEKFSLHAVEMPEDDEGGDAPPPVARVLEGRFPERTALNRKMPLEIRVAQENGAIGTHSAPLDASILPPQGGKVRLTVYAPGFSSEDGWSQTIFVSPDGDSSWVLFELIPFKVGALPIEVSAYFGSRFLGALKLQAQVTQTNRGGESQVRGAPIEFTPSSDDRLLLEIRNEDNAYSFRVHSNSYYGDEWTTGQLSRTAEAALEALVAQLDLAARGTNPLGDGNATREFLKGHGTILWNEFIPEPLKNFFWEHRSQFSRLTVITKDDALPWELLYPLGPDFEDEGFLVDQMEVARWTFGPSAPLQLSAKNPRFVLPDSNLDSAKAEVEQLRGIIPHANDAALLQTQAELLRELNEGGEFDTLHFACHNRFLRDSANDSYIEMDNRSRFSSVYLRNRRRWKPRAPLVFLNACRGAGQGASYTRSSGWATSFLERGAGAFISSLWEVRDESAARFAAAFYQSLCGGKTMGEAIRDGRNEIKDGAGDPTWLAYSFYGDPAAKLV